MAELVLSSSRTLIGCWEVKKKAYCPPGAARGQYDVLWTYVFSGEVDLNENKKGLGMFVGKVHIISRPATYLSISEANECLKARLHGRFLVRFFSFWCMRLNGLTYECIRPSVQNYINQYFCDSMAGWITCVRMRKIATKIARVLHGLKGTFTHCD